MTIEEIKAYREEEKRKKIWLKRETQQMILRMVAEQKAAAEIRSTLEARVKLFDRISRNGCDATITEP